MSSDVSPLFPLSVERMFQAGVLLAASLACGAIAIQAAKEAGPTLVEKRFPWLLGVGSVWYFFLTAQTLAGLGYIQAFIVRYAPLPIGLMRPGLLLFMAGLAYCYLGEQRTLKPKWHVWAAVSPTAVLLPIGGVINFAILSGRIFGEMKDAAKQLLFFSAFTLIALDLVLVLWAFIQITRAGKRSFLWLTAFATEAILLMIIFKREDAMDERLRWSYDLPALLLPLPLTVWLGFTRARYRFFDVFIKQGLFVAVHSLLIAMLVAALLGISNIALTTYGQGERTSQAVLAGCLIGLFLVPVTVCSLKLKASLDRWVNRALLNRPDYASVSIELFPKLQKATDEASAVGLVIATLKSVMQAGEVEFSPLPKSESESVVFTDSHALPSLQAKVGSGSWNAGSLTVAGKSDGLRYLSEDAAFLEKVANQLGGVLLTLHTQRERAAQERQTENMRQLAAQAHIRALQAQMNPHFLFNCLNLLNALVRTNPDQARRIMQRLAAVFRYSLDVTERGRTTLGEEVAFVENYLEIARARFGDRLSVNIEVAEELHFVRMPPMLMQPLVENALLHGIEPKVGQATLSVSAHIEEKWLCLEICDDGIGFEAAKCLKDAYLSDVSQRDPSHAGLGLHNVAERLRIQYGSVLHVDSAPQRGARVSFRIPIE